VRGEGGVVRHPAFMGLLVLLTVGVVVTTINAKKWLSFR
jgi:hypothetical protein